MREFKDTSCAGCPAFWQEEVETVKESIVVIGGEGKMEEVVSLEPSPLCAAGCSLTHELFADTCLAGLYLKMFHRQQDATPLTLN